MKKQLRLAEKTIAQLTEYRTALVTVAVTGKIDLRNVKIESTVDSAEQ
ncbi:hypothetical protein [Endozoicomonas sp. ALC020]